MGPFKREDGRVVSFPVELLAKRKISGRASVDAEFTALAVLREHCNQRFWFPLLL